MRAEDVLARIGGDQFALLVQAPTRVPPRPRRGACSKRWPQPHALDGAQFTLTCSIGVALCPGHGHGADDAGAARRSRDAR
jgi:GGDEF domain-containing protein